MAATRRLAAIMFTDTVGYTASMQADEREALRLRDEQEATVRPLFSAHQGREIKSTGDGFLVLFDSALRAVQCAVDIQEHLQERNSTPGVLAIRVRIGIHLGDVEERAGDIAGDSVNVASRIEPLAQPGGICISGTVFDLVRNKIPNRLEKLEPKVLKGVLFPMDVYRVHLAGTVKGVPSARPGPAELDKRRIAVLPLVNISPDPNDEYFADGLTEELITVLSQLRELLVIARTSVMQYKSTSKGVSQIGAELGVSAILEGSVRKAANRLRIAVQLIDVGSQGHTWVHTYDRELDDIFAVQVELAKQVAEALKVELQASEAARLEARPPVRPDSYLAYLKGRTLLHSISEAPLVAAKKQFELAISLDPTNAAAHSGLADATRLKGWWYPDVPRATWEETSRLLARRAIELDPNLAEAHASLGIILWDDFEYVGAERELKQALSLNPSYSLAHNWYAGLLEDENRADEALLEFTLAEEADPRWAFNLYELAFLLIWLGRLDEALLKIQQLSAVEPSGQWIHWALARFHMARSDIGRSLEEIQRVEELEEIPRWKTVERAWYYAVAGEGDRARELLRLDEGTPEYLPTPWPMGWVYAELGDLDSCFRWLERAVSSHSITFQPFRMDPRLEHVRSDPRFQTVLKKMNLA